ncbi:MAG: glxK [Clostridia bacterium]|nr:glxK [Clostridia bacterium]
MKIVIAPDSFKGSLSAKEVAENIKLGIERVYKGIDAPCIPMADGGEGTVQSLVDATGGRIITARVTGPLLHQVDAFYGILGEGRTAVIEMAAASGLPLVPENQRNPMLTTSYGTGELIKHALDMGCRDIIIGIGGSATNDGGFGVAKALGVKFLDKQGLDIGHGGGSLARLHTIDASGIDKRLRDCSITAACDVDNPLCGPRGATYVFGPQKGAKGDMLEVLDKNLLHYAEVIKEALGVDIKDIPGAGAAGGLGGGLTAFLGAKLQRGIDIVIETVKLEQQIRDAELVITGEGMMDYQTQYGKTPYGVAKIAKKYGIPVVALVGQVGKDAGVLYDMGIDSIFPIADGPMSLDSAMENGARLLQDAAERIIRLYKVAHNG